MNLQQELQATKRAFSKQMTSEQINVIDDQTNTLKKDKRSANAFREGDYIPYFELPDALGNKRSLDDFLKNGKAVISFYRGGWCPYCNLELRALQEILPDIKALNASLIAISPETPDNSLTTKQKNNLDYAILSDVDNTVSRQAGLVYEISQPLRSVYSSFNIDVEKHNGNKKFEIPMPATYVVDRLGKILYAYVPEDYTERSDPKEILKYLGGE